MDKWRYFQRYSLQRVWVSGTTFKDVLGKGHEQAALPARTFAAKGINKRCRQRSKTQAMPLARLLLRHDFQHHIVGGAHGFFADAREVVNALIHAIIDDSLG